MVNSKNINIDNKNKVSNKGKKNSTKKLNNKVDLEKTNSYDLVFDDDRMKDSQSLDVSFIDGKKKKAPKIDMTNYKYENDCFEIEHKKKGEVVSIILIILLSFVLGCLFLYILVRDDFNRKQEKVKIQTETKVVMDNNYVFLGDSIFEEYDIDEFYPNMPVVNSSVSGDKTVDILKELKERVYKYNPSKVFLMIGTNDIKAGVEVEEIALNIEKIVNSIMQNRPYAEIYVQSISPINNTDSDKIEHDIVGSRTNIDIQKVNEIVRNMCVQKDITYIDLYSKLIDKDGNLNIDYTVEGLHINDAGYEVITQEIMKYIN